MSKSLRSSLAQNAKKLGGLTPAKADPFDTNEKKIKELRNQRSAKLAVARYDFIDALIEEFDSVQAAVTHLGASTAALLKRAETAEEVHASLATQIAKLHGDLNAEILRHQAARDINIALSNQAEELDTAFRQAKLERDEARLCVRKLITPGASVTSYAAQGLTEWQGPSESEKLQAELEPLPLDTPDNIQARFESLPERSADGLPDNPDHYGLDRPRRQ